MTRHYCCYFDHRYLPRGLLMIRSLRQYEPYACFWVLCLNDECYRIMAAMAEPGVRLVRLDELEATDVDLASARHNRSLIEYYFTCTPAWLCHVLRQVEPESWVTYVDSDLYFFSDPQPLYEELGTGSVSLIEHRFAPAVRHLERFGIYNVGWMTFRNSAEGLRVAQWWRERCIEWCYDTLDGDRFADQKYLEQFARLFEGIVVLRNPGANLAPWNLGGHHLTSRDGRVIVDAAAPLVFFHFHGLRVLGGALYVVEHSRYGAGFSGIVRDRIYKPYVLALAAITKEVSRFAPPRSGTLARHASSQGNLLERIIGKLRRPLKNAFAIIRLEFVLVIGGRAI